MTWATFYCFVNWSISSHTVHILHNYVIEERDSSKADELFVDTAKLSADGSQSVTVWSMNYVTVND